MYIRLYTFLLEKREKIRRYVFSFGGFISTVYKVGFCGRLFMLIKPYKFLLVLFELFIKLISLAGILYYVVSLY